MSQKFSVTRGSMFLAALNKAHSDAINELIMRNGVVLNEEEISSIAGLRGIDYHSFIHTQAQHFSEEFQMFLKNKFVEHWEETYIAAQQGLIDLTRV